jgi:hypothetical protein
MASIAAASSLFEIDMELDSLLDQMQEQVALGGEPSEDLVARFHQFCEAHGFGPGAVGKKLSELNS